MKKLFSFVCALVCAMSLSARDLYLVPNSNWLQASARFSVYSYGDGETWVDMVAVDGTTNTFKATIDDKYPKVIFCRMNPSSTENGWSNKWNQTGDLVLADAGSNNCYTINEGSWDTGTWSVFNAGSEGGEGGGTTTTYYIKHPWGGGSSWEWKALTPNGDGTYSIRDIYGGAGCNWKSTVSTSEPYIASPTLEGSPAKGDSAIFTLTSTEGDGAITITKIASTGGEGGGSTDPSVTEYWYFDENNTKWEGTIDDKWKMTVSGDIAYVKVPAGEKANKFKIFPCNPKVDAKVLANDDNIAESPLAGDIALSKDTEEWKNILIGATTADYFVVLYLPNTTTNNSAKYLVAAMTQLPNSGSDPTALTNTEVENAVVKVIRNGQVLIVREGVTYNMMGQTIQ